MIQALLDLITFLSGNFGLLFALAFYTILAVAFAKNIKKHAKVYYWVFGLLSAAFVIPTLFRVCGATFPFSFGKIPFFGPCVSELSSAANFVHPVLILIMYMGAFSPKVKFIAPLMSIRKELSIIVGFPVISHAMKRIFGSFVQGWSYFFDHETFMQSPRVTSALGSGISSFVYVLGIVMFVLFLVLWITSFDSVHKALGAKRWKAVQKWSYGLYAMLFIHAMGLSLGGYISDKAREQQQSQRPQTEVVSQHQQGGERQQQAQSGHGQQQQGQQQAQSGHGQQQQGQQQAQSGHGQQQQGQQQAQSGHGRNPAFKFNDIEISRGAKRVINMITYILIYGSYLYFRLRKKREDQAKKSAAAAKR